MTSTPESHLESCRKSVGRLSVYLHNVCVGVGREGTQFVLFRAESDKARSLKWRGWVTILAAHPLECFPGHEKTMLERSDFLLDIALDLLGPKLLLPMGCVKLGAKNCVHLPSMGEQTAN